jgi:hypothetical protein
MAKLNINDIMSSKIYPVHTKSEAADTLQALIHDIGIPHALHSNEAREITEGRFMALCRDFSIPCTQTEAYSPWQNHCEHTCS